MLSTKSIAHVSTRRPWITVGAWIAVVVVAMGLIATMLGEELKTNAGLTSEPESIEAQRLIRERFATSGPRLAAGSLVMFQQMGFGLAGAVFIDATLVQLVLVPASMKLLGTRNRYFPSWLHWLPDLSEARSLEAEAASD
jgi:uncharacterized membrane protein YdfJ with MMPL/SSD domain